MAIRMVPEAARNADPLVRSRASKLCGGKSSNQIIAMNKFLNCHV
jgi:hypothetical protein